jgi:hypothetical protein|tara:strand:+ start:135 stop:1061 length:927 start_codon:yes stop_codon:yes gene_type:complete
MKTSDITQTIFILFLFSLLSLFNSASGSVKNIKENWHDPKVRCNPAIMPFANVFDQDVMTNFNFCIERIQGNYMGELMQPLTGNFDILGKIGTNITKDIQGIREFFNSLRNMMGSSMSGIFSVFLNIIIEFQRMLINLKSIMGKLVGTLATFVYTISGVLFTMESGWNGLPGKMVRALCFDPETKILTNDNKLIPMSEIELGTILKNGTRVSSVMKISNLDEKGNYVEDMYEVKNGEDTKTIYVTGSHLIYDPEIKDFVEVKNLRGITPSILSEKKCKELSCLITSDNTIPIGDWIFHDWEDKRFNKL